MQDKHYHGAGGAPHQRMGRGGEDSVSFDQDKGIGTKAGDWGWGGGQGWTQKAERIEVSNLQPT